MVVDRSLVIKTEIKNCTSILLLLKNDGFCLNIRIHHECEGGIEKSVPRIRNWHQEPCRVITNGDQTGQIFLSHPHTNNKLFFLLTTKYLIYTMHSKFSNCFVWVSPSTSYFKIHLLL